MVTGAGIKVGDVLIGLPSTGLHTNGYSLARKLLFEVAGYRRRRSGCPHRAVGEDPGVAAAKSSDSPRDSVRSIRVGLGMPDWRPRRQGMAGVVLGKFRGRRRSH